MGSSSKQTTGYRYFSNFLLFIGNPIEKLLGINFDKRGWQNPLVDENQNALEVGTLNLPNLYGENEGGVAGKIYAQYGTNNQPVVPFYKSYMDAQDLPASAFPYQSYLAFTGLGEVPVGGWAGNIINTLHGQYGTSFYLGNSGYMKEMLLWPQRIHVRNDGRLQWYDEKAEIPDQNGEEIEQIEARYSDLYNFSTEINGTELQQTDRYAIRRFSFERNAGSIKLGIGFIYDSIEDQVFSVLIQSTSGPATFIESDGFKLINTEILSDDDYWPSRKIFHFEIPKGAPGMRSALFGVSFSGNYADPLKLSEAYVEIHQPQPPVSGMLISSISSLDINPIHKIREILTDDTAMNKPESDVNDINFKKAADRIYDECLGISWSITKKPCLDAINELCGHIEAGARVNRQTGLYEIVLFRDDWFEESEIHTLAVNKIKGMQLDPPVFSDELINKLNVSFYNRDAIKDSSFSISENAAIRNLGGTEVPEDADFPYFMNQRNAAVVAQWKLKQMSSPVWSGSFTTAAYEARKWNRYDLLKLAWPRKWQGTITVRIMKINLGTGTDVSIDFVEVVPYSSELSSNIVIDTPIDVATLPPQTCQYEPFELPYFLAVMALGQRQVDDELTYENNYGLVGVVAEKPQNNSLYAVMMTHDGSEGEEWLRAATIDYETTADLDQSISKRSTSFTVKNSNVLVNIAAGTLMRSGSDWIGAPSEWMVFQSIDPNTGVVTVKRGALDSLPQVWGANTKLYFCGNDVAYDQTEYIAGEEVLVAALTTTPSGLQELNGSIAIEMNARAFRPYPPANVKINGEYWPAEIETDLILTWVDRNRIQQTGGSILGWFDAGATLESGVTYQLILTELDESQIELRTQNLSLGMLNSYMFATAEMDANTRTIEITLKTLRDGFECLNPFIHIVELSQFFSAPYALTAEFKNE